MAFANGVATAAAVLIGNSIGEGADEERTWSMSKALSIWSTAEGRGDTVYVLRADLACQWLIAVAFIAASRCRDSSKRRCPAPSGEGRN